jgi:hypothetical protein
MKIRAVIPRHRVSPSASPMTGSCGVSSTLRPLDSIISVSGILDRPLSRAMTTEGTALAYSPTRDHIPAARCARVLTKPFARQRAWGMPGARRTRSLVCKVLVAHECSHHRYSRIHPAFPHAMVLTAYFVLSPVTGLVCHRRRRSCLRQLDASVGASGPHDFAVRESAVRQRHCHVHRIPRPTSVTIAKRPSV